MSTPKKKARKRPGEDKPAAAAVVEETAPTKEEPPAPWAEISEKFMDVMGDQFGQYVNVQSDEWKDAAGPIAQSFGEQTWILRTGKTVGERAMAREMIDNLEAQIQGRLARSLLPVPDNVISAIGKGVRVIAQVLGIALPA